MKKIISVNYVKQKRIALKYYKYLKTKLIQ